ncbi:LysR family transcriptional regulator [Actinomycetes bacterium M1A6_2h]
MPLPTHVTDLVSYELLLSVAELGSIGRAGQAHGMSQPAASARLKALESRVGVALLHRGQRGATLTPTGQLVAGWAGRVIAEATDLATNIAALRTDRDSHIRIAASLTVAEYLVPRWLITLRSLDPTVAPALSSGNSDDVAASVLAGRADIGFIESPDVPTGLESREFARDELVVVVAPHHPWVGKTITGIDLAATPLVTREAGSGTRLALERALAEFDPLAAPVLEVSSTTAIKSAVGGGLAPAVLSHLAVSDDIAAGTLVRVRTRDVDLRRSLRAVWPSGRTLRGPASDLLGIALGIPQP